MNKDYFNFFLRTTKEKIDEIEKKNEKLEEIRKRLQSKEVYEYLKLTGQLEANQMRYMGIKYESSEDIIRDSFEKFSVTNKERDTAHIFASWLDNSIGIPEYVSYQNIELDKVDKIALDEVEEFEKGKKIIKISDRQDFFRVQGEFAISAYYNGQDKANEEILNNYSSRVLLRRKK